MRIREPRDALRRNSANRLGLGASVLEGASRVGIFMAQPRERLSVRSAFGEIGRKPRSELRDRLEHLVRDRDRLRIGGNAPLGQHAPARLQCSTNLGHLLDVRLFLSEARSFETEHAFERAPELDLGQGEDDHEDADHVRERVDQRIEIVREPTPHRAASARSRRRQSSSPPAATGKRATRSPASRATATMSRSVESPLGRTSRTSSAPGSLRARRK